MLEVLDEVHAWSRRARRRIVRRRRARAVLWGARRGDYPISGPHDRRVQARADRVAELERLILKRQHDDAAAALKAAGESLGLAAAAVAEGLARMARQLAPIRQHLEDLDEARARAARKADL